MCNSEMAFCTRFTNKDEFLDEYPSIVTLEDHEKFKDDVGNDSGIRVWRGRSEELALFCLEDILRVFDHPRLMNYLEGNELVIKNPESLKYDAFVTYDMMLRTLYDTDDYLAKKFRLWGTRRLFVNPTENDTARSSLALLDELERLKIKLAESRRKTEEIRIKYLKYKIKRADERLMATSPL